MLKTTKLAQVTREFRNCKLELLGLSEIRWKGSGERRLSCTEVFGEFILECENVFKTFSRNGKGSHSVNCKFRERSFTSAGNLNFIQPFGFNTLTNVTILNVLLYIVTKSLPLKLSTNFVLFTPKCPAIGES